MSFRLKRRESIPKGIKRIVRERLRDAVAALDDGASTSDTDIHAARKRFKEARAAIRLVRNELGRAVFERENKSIRDVARPLSAVRDAKVLIERFDALNEQFEGRVEPESLANLRGELMARRRSIRNRAIGSKGALASILRHTRGVRKRSKRWPLRRRGWNAIEPGLRKVYKKGRAAMRDACAHRTDEPLHEWRKSAKDLRYQLQLLQDTRPSVVKELAERAHRLTDLLGEDHDLAVMRAVVREISLRSICTDVSALTELIVQRRRVLQMHAFAVGEAVYEQKTETFMRRLRHYWKASR